MKQYNLFNFGILKDILIKRKYERARAKLKPIIEMLDRQIIKNKMI